MSRQAPPNGVGFNVFPVAPATEGSKIPAPETGRAGSTEPEPCPSCDRDLSYPGAPGHECYTYAQHRARVAEKLDPETLLCDACGAEPNEPCRFGCLGYYVEHGDV